MSELSESSFQEILAPLAAQLSKDLNLEFSSHPAELVEQLIAHCQTLVGSGFSAIAQTLYRVDVNEAQFHFQLQERRDESEAVLLARSILKRELEKVIFRKAHTAGLSVKLCLNRILSS